MAVNIKFDLAGNPEPPTIILANRNGNKLGLLNINDDSIELVDKFNDASEFSFTMNKYIDGKLNHLWDKVVNFKLVYCDEWDLWFEIVVELDESNETVKTVTCTQLGQAELSQINLYGIHINEEGDSNWNKESKTYKSTILYNPEDTSTSLLHRLLHDKAPHYHIAYVDPTIAKLQRTFSFDGTSIYDAFMDIAEEIGCLFVFHSNGKDKINRTISVYDLWQNCKSCGHRGEYIDECPECGSKDIKYGYGEDTLIFVTADELASDGIELTADTDSVKNCFKLEAGDDLMTATIRNCNPNGTDYIWRFSEDMKEDMSEELVKKLDEYDDKYNDCRDNYVSELDADLFNGYNALVEKYEEKYNAGSSKCLSCNYKDDSFVGNCPKCGSSNTLIKDKLKKLTNPINGYSSLMNTYYNVVDLALFLESSMMPSIDLGAKTNAKEQATLLTASSLSPVAVANIKTASKETAKSAVLSMAKIIVKSTYKLEAETSGELNDNGDGTKTWNGYFTITNYSDETDTAITDIVSVVVNGDSETFIQQKIDKALNKEDSDDYSISGLFEMDYDAFCDELKIYALNPLKSFYDASQTCLTILTEQGAGDKEKNKDLYDALYKPYFDKSVAIEAEMKIRESEVDLINGVYKIEIDADGKETSVLDKDGLKQNIEKCRNKIQEELDFEKYLGNELWVEFCSYRREDTYSNDNYKSDGLSNAELFKKATEFYEVANNEIYKSSEFQHSISTDLNNLLAINKFKPLVDSFNVGNWIRVQVDDKVYKLRLIEYSIDFGSFENISVDFSDVTKIKNGITDVKEVLSQASSMATSYSSVQRQAEQGNEAKGTVEQWIENGLNSALVRIQNNNNEEVVLTESGLLCRSYDDVTDTYLPEQFRLTHNIMAYTDDNWTTVSSALGKHEYTKWTDNQWITDIGYGLSSKFVTAGYITGSQIVGGEIVSSGYKPKENGTYLDLIGGDFDFAGGKIVYNSSNNALTLKDVTIAWDSNTNAPEVTDITGLSDYLDELEKLDGRIQTYSQTTDPSISWTNEEKEEHIGDLWINPETGITQTWDGASWKVVTDSELAELAKSKAQIFTTTPTPPYYVGDLWVQGSTGDILHCVVSKAEGQSFSQNDWAKSSKYTDDTVANSAKGIAENAREIGNKLVNGLGFQETEITGQYVISPVIAGGTLLIGDKSGTYAQITTNGKLICTGANISGDIVANSLTLGNSVSISANKINGLSSVATSGNYNDLSNKPTIPASVGELGLDTSKIMYKGDVTQTTKTDSNGISYIETSVPTSDGTITYSTYDADDYIVFGRSKGTNSDGNNYVCVSKDGLLTARNALIYGTIYATSGDIGGCKIEGGKLKVGSANIDGTLTIGQLPSSVAETSDIPTKLSQLSNDSGYETASSIKNTVITKDYIETLNIRAGSVAAENITGTTISGKTIEGSTFYSENKFGDMLEIKDSTISFIQNGNKWASMSIEPTLGEFGIGTLSDVDMKFYSHKTITFKPYSVDDYGSIVMGCSWKDDGINIRPFEEGGHCQLGDSNHPFKYIHSINDVTVSDRRLKKNIDDDFSQLEEVYKNLKPIIFEYSNMDDDKKRFGFIAQDVESAFVESGFNPDEFAILQKSEISADSETANIIGDTITYSLNDKQLIALNTHMVQSLMNRVEYLEDKIKELENK